MTMNEQKIGEALMGITNTITDRIGRQPGIRPYMMIDDSGRCNIVIYADRSDPHKCTGCAKGNSFDEVLDAAWSIVNAIPSPEDHARAKFTQAVGAAIEAGKDAGIDLEFINPLKEMMTRLSENAITYKDR